MSMNRVKRPDIKPVMVIYFISLSILVGLGAWQAKRGMDKRELEKQISESGFHPVNLNEFPGPVENLNYRNVRATGNWHWEHVFLLDNRIHAGKVGYEVLVPFALANGETTFLTNVGWLEKPAADGLRDTLPATAEEEIHGQLYFPQKGFALGPNMTDSTTWPRVVQTLDIPELSAVSGRNLESGVIVMEPDADSGFIKIWQPYVVNATRHFGYAGQWWGLAAVLVVFGVIWYRMGKKSHEP